MLTVQVGLKRLPTWGWETSGENGQNQICAGVQHFPQNGLFGHLSIVAFSECCLAELLLLDLAELLLRLELVDLPRKAQIV